MIFKNKARVILEKLSEITLSESKESSVISLGGGAFLNNTLKKYKKIICNFWLDVSINELIRRLKSKKRPLLINKKYMKL